jgi:hypothetical protein
MDLESATQTLYRIAPARFTSTRDAMATEARDAGQRELASSLRKLRKPSVGAWLANLLVFEQPSDVKQLVHLGAELRSPKRKVERDRIRRVSKDKGDAVSKLVQDARSIASREGQSISEAASLELEATLEAAFADPQAAKSLLEGRLSSGLAIRDSDSASWRLRDRFPMPRVLLPRDALSRPTQAQQSATWPRLGRMQNGLMLRRREPVKP